MAEEVTTVAACPMYECSGRLSISKHYDVVVLVCNTCTHVFKYNAVIRGT